MPQLRLFLFGAPRVELDGELAAMDTRKAIALLAYLAITGERHTRDALAVFLWPEYDQRRSRANLRRTLSVLKAGLGGYGLSVERETLGIDPQADIWVDVHHFMELLGECARPDHPAAGNCRECLGPLSEAVSAYAGDFMSGFTLRDSPSFDSWQYHKGEALRRELSGALTRLADCHCELGQFEAAIDYARRLLDLDALHEPAHRQLMTLYSLSGQRAAALRQYRECVRVLDEELGVPPLEETTALYEQILAGEIAAISGASTVTSSAAARVRLPPRLPLVGRSSEWDELLAAYREVENDGRLAILEGEAGIGKTRLAEAFVEAIQEQGARVVLARCYEGESNLAYGPLLEGINAAMSRGEADAWWHAIPAEWLAEAARLVPEVSRLQPDLPPVAALESPGAQSRFFEGVSRLIQALCGASPAGVLFLDDLHWADEATVDLLAYLVRRLSGRPIFLLFNWRADLIDPDHQLRLLLAEGQRAGTVRRISLDRLPESAVRELVSASASAPERSKDVARQLYDETEGLPFFVVEYLSIWDSERAIPESAAYYGRQSGNAIPALDAAWPMPSGVRELLRSRIAGTSETGRQLLQAAAVIGRSFDFDTLREASGRSEEESVVALEALLARGLVTERREEQRAGASGERPQRQHGPIYDFSHEKLRSLVYEQTTLARRRLLHRRVADTLVAGRRERGGAPRGKAPNAQIAHHYQLAGREALAGEYFVLAGDEARELYANAEALLHYRSALALGHEEAPALHEAIGDLNTLLGEYDAALSSYETAAALSGEPAETGSLARLEHKLGNVYQRQGEWELAAGHFAAALPAMVNEGEKAQLLADWSLAAHHGGDSIEAVSLAEKALAQAEAAGDVQALAQAHNILGVLASSNDHLPTARRHLEQSLDLAGELADPGVKIAALNNLALALSRGGEEEKALALAEEALALCVARGDRHHEAALHNNVADLLHSSGRSEEAMEHIKRSAAIYAEIGGEPGDWRPEIWKLAEW